MSDDKRITPTQQAEHDTVVKEARVRYVELCTTWVDFVVYLRGVEHSGKWRLPHYSDFGDWLAFSFPAAFGVRRYLHVAKAVEVYGTDFMRRMGAEPAHALTRDAVLRDPENVAKMREWCEAHWERNKVMPDANTVRGWALRLTPAEEVHPPKVAQEKAAQDAMREEVIELRRKEVKAEKAIFKAENLSKTKQQLEDEVKRLKAELKVANARIKQLEAENAKQAKRLQRLEAKGKKGGGQPRADA